MPVAAPGLHEVAASLRPGSLHRTVRCRQVAVRVHRDCVVSWPSCCSDVDATDSGNSQHDAYSRSDGTSTLLMAIAIRTGIENVGEARMTVCLSSTCFVPRPESFS